MNRQMRRMNGGIIMEGVRTLEWNDDLKEKNYAWAVKRASRAKWSQK